MVSLLWRGVDLVRVLAATREARSGAPLGLCARMTMGVTMGGDSGCAWIRVVV